jgi:protoporphyrinogen oxidase
MSDAPIVILGAGPAGLAAALALGADAVVLDRRPAVGGLTGSVEIDGAVFDVGGHSFHTPHPEVRQLVFEALAMHEQQRDARCHALGTTIPYPFQRYFRALPDPAVVDECERGLREADGGAGAPDLAAYLARRFGAGIARHFLLPYNRKLWGCDLAHLTPAWAGERIAAPDGVPERFDAGNGARTPLQDDTTVAYPARGGFGEIAQALSRRVRDLRLGAGVTRIEPARAELVTASGDVMRWRCLVSTLPLNELVKITAGVPAALRDDAARLEHLSLRLVFVVIGHRLDTAMQRLYTADPGVAAHKIVLNHNSSPYLRGRPHHGIAGEISYSEHKPLPRADVTRGFVRSLRELGLVRSAREVRRVSAIDVQYAYPLPTLDRDAIVARLKEWLEAQRIYSVGRFGEWAYINSDEAMHRGLALARRLDGAAWQASA